MATSCPSLNVSVPRKDSSSLFYYCFCNGDDEARPRPEYLLQYYLERDPSDPVNSVNTFVLFAFHDSTRCILISSYQTSPRLVSARPQWITKLVCNHLPWISQVHALPITSPSPPPIRSAYRTLPFFVGICTMY